MKMTTHSCYTVKHISEGSRAIFMYEHANFFIMFAQQNIKPHFTHLANMQGTEKKKKNLDTKRIVSRRSFNDIYIYIYCKEFKKYVHTSL